MRLPCRVTVLAGVLAALMVPGAQAAPQYTSRVLVNNLANPRGLLVSGDRVLVSEAGSGGPALAGGTNCILSGANTTLCSGATGVLGAWDLTTQTYSPLIPGLPSLAQANGTEGTGLADLTSGGPTGLLGVFGFGGDPSANNPALLGSPLFGQVVSIDLSNGTLQARANLSAYEQTNNPDGGDITSNPYGLQAFGGKLYATDAGGNTLLSLGLTPDPLNQSFPILAAFAFPTIPITPPPPFPPGAPDPFPASAVPTGLTVNPATNKLLIGEFGGYPFKPASSSLYATDGLANPAPALTGFTSITDVAADSAGNTYVLEYTSYLLDPNATGSIWRVSGAGTRERLIDGLKQPTSLALGPDGLIFVSQQADGLQGQLVEYRPVPAPLPLLGAAMAWRQARHLRRRVRPTTLGSSGSA